MYFLIAKGTETHKKLSDLSDKIESCRDSARKLVKKLGGKKKYSHALNVLAGGVSGIEFDEKPEGWKRVGESYQNLYYPKAHRSMNAVLGQISDLPVVEYDDLNSIVGFEAPQTVSPETGFGIAWVNTVSMIFGDEFYLMAVTKGCDYKPNKDIVEILESQYVKLEKQIEQKRKKNDKKG